MKYIQLYFLLILTILPLLGCRKSPKYNDQLKDRSYIHNFELLQKSPSNNRSIKITSPKALINSINNDVEIFDSRIQILNKNGDDFQVKSGNSTLNNFSNLIRAFNNVELSFLDKQDYFINTSSFYWDLNTSIIDIDSHLIINFDNTKIISTNGIYNIYSGLLNIDNSILNRNVHNSEGKEKYQIEIKSDFAKWYKNDNKLVFTSNNKQVETTIKFLSLK